MALTLKVTCDRCGESVETSLAISHLCQRLSLPDVETLIDKFLADLAGRSGFKMNDKVRAMLRADWRWIAAELFRTKTPDPEPTT